MIACASVTDPVTIVRSSAYPLSGGRRARVAVSFASWALRAVYPSDNALVPRGQLEVGITGALLYKRGAAAGLARDLVNLELLRRHLLVEVDFGKPPLITQVVQVEDLRDLGVVEREGCSLGAALMGLLAHLTRDPDS